MIGYDVPEVRDAVERQIASGVVHTSTLYLIRGQVELAEKIARLSGIEDAKVFFTNSGTEANETALLLATPAARRPTRSSPCATATTAARSAPIGDHRQPRLVGHRAVARSACTTCTAATGYRSAVRAACRDADYIDACVADLRDVLASATTPATSPA